jgi:hypothetical protein
MATGNSGHRGWEATGGGWPLGDGRPPGMGGHLGRPPGQAATGNGQEGFLMMLFLLFTLSYTIVCPPPPHPVIMVVQGRNLAHGCGIMSFAQLRIISSQRRKQPRARVVCCPRWALFSTMIASVAGQCVVGAQTHGCKPTNPANNG